MMLANRLGRPEEIFVLFLDGFPQELTLSFNFTLVANLCQIRLNVSGQL